MCGVGVEDPTLIFRLFLGSLFGKQDFAFLFFAFLICRQLLTIVAVYGAIEKLVLAFVQ